MPTHEGIAEELFLGQNPELKRKVFVEDGNVERREMIHSVNVGLAGIYLLQTFHIDMDADCAQDHSRPQPRKSVLDAAIAIKEGRKQRKQAEDYGVKPDQRVPEKE